MAPKSDALERRGLAKGLRVFLDLILGLILLAGIALIVVRPVLVWTGHEVYQVTIPVTISEDAIVLPMGSEGLSLIETRGELKFVPDHFVPKLVYWILTVVVVTIFVYGILLLRRILATTAKGFPFHPLNPRRLSDLGWIIVSTSLLATAAEFLAGRWALSNPRFENLPLSPIFDLGQGWIFTGLLVLVLAAIWKEAVRMAEEQSLTV
jgi:hypothetical protein